MALSGRFTTPREVRYLQAVRIALPIVVSGIVRDGWPSRYSAVGGRIVGYTTDQRYFGLHNATADKTQPMTMMAHLALGCASKMGVTLDSPGLLQWQVAIEHAVPRDTLTILYELSRRGRRKVARHLFSALLTGDARIRAVVSRHGHFSPVTKGTYPKCLTRDITQLVLKICTDYGDFLHEENGNRHYVIPLKLLK